MTGACTCLTISGTAFAAASLLTVTRTSSLPAAWSALTCATVPAMSAVSVLVMDWTMMGRSLPTLTPPTSTSTVFLRFEKLISAPLYHGDRGLPERRGIVDNRRPETIHPIEEIANARRPDPAGSEAAHRQDARPLRVDHRGPGHDRQVRGGDGRPPVDPRGRRAREEGDAGGQDHRPRLPDAVARASAGAPAHQGREAQARHQLRQQQGAVHQHRACRLAHPPEADHQER